MQKVVPSTVKRLAPNVVSITEHVPSSSAPESNLEIVVLLLTEDISSLGWKVKIGF